MRARRGNTASIAAALLLAAACAGSPPPAYPARPTSDYALSVARDGVTLAIEPLPEPERCERHFATDLAASDILPIFVAVENRGEASLLLLRIAVRIRVAGSGLAPPPLVVHSLRAVTSHRSLVLHQLEANELLDVTLSPGEVASGFRYFHLRDVPDGPQRIALEVSLTDLGNREQRTLSLEFPWQRRKRS
jgi:hypothetical protein